MKEKILSYMWVQNWPRHRFQKSYTPPFLIFRTFAFPPSNFLGIFIRVVSFRSFTLFVYARFLRLRLIVGVVVRALLLLLLLLLLIHYFITRIEL